MEELLLVSILILQQNNLKEEFDLCNFEYLCLRQLPLLIPFVKRVTPEVHDASDIFQVPTLRRDIAVDLSSNCYRRVLGK